MAGSTIWNSIRTKILLIFALTALPFLVVLFIVDESYKDAFDNVSSVHHQQDRQSFLLGSLQVELELQMLNWKNLLLRGEQAILYHKHLTKFFDHERAVIALSRKMSNSAIENSLTARTLEAFDHVHRDLGKAQRKAIRIFNSPVANAAAKADLTVGSTEEQAVAQIRIVARAIEDEKNFRISAINDGLRKAQTFVISSSLAILVAAAIVLWWIASGGILVPINRALQASRHIASGNLEQKINTDFTGEMGGLLSSLDRMRMNLAEVINQRELLLNGAGEGIYGVDTEGRCSFINPAAAKLLGWKAEDLIGQPQHEILHHSRADGSPYPVSECPIYAAFMDGQIHKVDDEVFWRKDGSSFAVEYTSTPMFENGEPVGAVVMFRDITERKKVENERRASERRFRDMIEASSDWFWETDAEHRFSFVSQRGPETLGVDIDEIIGKRRWEFDQNSRNTQFWRDHRSDLNNRQLFRDVEYIHSRPGSENIAVSVNGLPVFADDGRFLGYRGTARNVTKRRQVELALRISEDRFNKSQDFANIGTWDWNIQTGNLYWSDRIAPLFGYPKEELDTTYDNFVNAIHPDDRQKVTAAVNACVEEGAEYNIEHRTIWPDGSIHYLLEKGDVVRDEDDQPLNMLGVVQDITAVKLAELALAKNEIQYREIVEGTDDLVTIVDGEGHFLFVNHKANDILGVSPEECVGKLAFESIHPEDREKTTEAFMSWIENRETSVTHENRLQNVNGTVFYMLWSINIHYDEDGEVTMMRSIARDNTERHQMLAQLIQSSKMATLGEMATGVAHELNQPLNIIRLALNNIQRKLGRNVAEPEYLTGKLDKIDAQIERATEIIDHMRIFGRKPAATPMRLDPREMTEKSLSLLGEQLRLSEIDVSVKAPDHCRNIFGHQVQVEQVLLNLLGNARDAVLGKKEGDKRIVITVSDNEESVLISIEDTGGGIDPDNLARVFEPFFTTKDIGLGTGLGLSISYGIIKDMGGNIVAENTQEGARFNVTLPAMETEKEAT